MIRFENVSAFLTNVKVMGVKLLEASDPSSVSYLKLINTAASWVCKPVLNMEILTPSTAIANVNPKLFHDEAILFVKSAALAKGARIKDTIALGLMAVVSNGWEILNASVMSGDHLRENETMLKHYGVTANIAKNDVSVVSQDAKKYFRELMGREMDSKSPEGPIAFGGFQFMEQAGLSVEQLDALWKRSLELDDLSKEKNDRKKYNIKLAPGTYVAPVKYEDGGFVPVRACDVDERTVFILNGFTPAQMISYTRPQDRVVVLRVRRGSGQAASLKKMRGVVIGPTNPRDGSGIRNDLFKNMEQYGVLEVDKNQNGYHFSAGPIEFLYECENFFGTKPEETSIGRLLMQRAQYSPAEIRKLMANPLVKWNGNIKSVFDHTEEMSAEEVIIIFAKAIKSQLN